MRALTTGLLSLVLAGCSAATVIGGKELNVKPEVVVSLPDLGPAPELRNKVWLNSDQPLRLSDLRGKVVLLDM